MNDLVELIKQFSLPTVAVSLLLYGAEYLRRRFSARRDARRQAVERVLDALERAMRRHVGFSRYLSTSPAIDYAVVYPRLALELPGKSVVVAGWLWRQVQHLLLETDPTASLRRQSELAGRLVSWCRGETRLPWFVQQLAADPVDHNFTVPLSVKLRRDARIFGNSALGTAAVLAVVATAKRALGAF